MVRVVKIKKSLLLKNRLSKMRSCT